MILFKLQYACAVLQIIIPFTAAIASMQSYDLDLWRWVWVSSVFCANAQHCSSDGQMWTDRLTDPWMIVHLSAAAAESRWRSTVAILILWIPSCDNYHGFVFSHLSHTPSALIFRNYIFTSAQIFNNSSKLTFFFLCIAFLLLFPSPLCITYLFLFIPVNLYSCLPVSPLPPTRVVCAHCVVLQHFLLHRSPPQMNPK